MSVPPPALVKENNMNISYVSLAEMQEPGALSSLDADIYFFDKNRSEEFCPPQNFFTSEAEITDSLWFFQLKPRIVDAAPVYISIIRHAYVLPCGIVVTKDGKILLESIYPRTINNIKTIEDLLTSERDLELYSRLVERNLSSSDALPLARAVHGRDIGERGYFHWIATVLPRVSLVADRFFGETGPYLINPHPEFGVEWLRELGLYDKILIPDSRIIHVDELIFPCPAQVGDSHYTRNRTLLLDFKRRLQNNGIIPQKDGVNAEENIYISRSDAPVRRLINEDDLIDSVKRFNFSKCTLSGMSVREQASLFSSAKTVMGPHGAGLVNVLFGQSSTTVIELMSITRTWPGFKVISKIVDSKYCGFVSGSYVLSDSEVKGYGNEDFSVDVLTCNRFIESCLTPR